MCPPISGLAIESRVVILRDTWKVAPESRAIISFPELDRRSWTNGRKYTHHHLEQLIWLL